MFIPRNSRHFPLVAGILLASCSDAPASDSDPAAASEPSDQQLLAALELSAGHKIYFYDEGEGFSIAEGFAAGEPLSWSVTDDMKGLSVVELYQRLAPSGAAIPASVLDADARYKAAAERTEELAPPTVASEQCDGPALYTDAEQEWFRATFCVDRYNIECLQGWLWANSGWHLGTWFQTSGYVNTGGAVSTLRAYRWDGWQQVLVGAKGLGSNEVWRFSFSWSSPSYWRASLDNAGDHQLSLSCDVATFLKDGPRR
jgi:hypothetical protein